ncbi:hypothetical protein F5Y15DRAFT_430525 [Xylariaceae sp. FL0016]|nr:hypothetical protein F5Y15DRAFT_430525 [Xylariaceae sp. FL0016]
MEAVREAEERLREITGDLNATAGALRQLEAVLESGRQVLAEAGDPERSTTGELARRSTILNDAERRDIESLAARCEKVYRVFTTLVGKAAGSSTDDDGNVLDHNSLPATGLRLRQRLKWPWLRPRIDRWETPLRWLTMTLHFHLSLATFGTIPDQEQALQFLAEELRSRRAERAKELASAATATAPEEHTVHINHGFEELGSLADVPAPVYAQSSEHPHLAIAVKRPNVFTSDDAWGKTDMLK